MNDLISKAAYIEHLSLSFLVCPGCDLNRGPQVTGASKVFPRGGGVPEPEHAEGLMTARMPCRDVLAAGGAAGGQAQIS